VLRGGGQPQRGGTADGGRAANGEPQDRVVNLLYVVQLQIDEFLRQLGLVDDAQLAGKQLHALFMAGEYPSFGSDPPYGFQHRVVPFVEDSGYTILQLQHDRNNATDGGF